jgi:hypothetical protein
MRFDGSSTYWTFTPSAGGDEQRNVFAMWMKHCTSTSAQMFFANNVGNGFYHYINTSTGQYNITLYPGSTMRVLTSVWRDPGAWFHFCLYFDTSNGDEADRCKIWINGVRSESAGAATLDEDKDTDQFGATEHVIGRSAWDANSYFHGYMAEIVGTEGVAFTDPITDGLVELDTNGNLIPSDISASGLVYGDEGFYLNGTNNGTVLQDQSGNGNDWAVNNFSFSDDLLTDSPTDDAANDVGNYCTLNPLYKGSAMTLSNGNLEVSVSTNWHSAISTWVLSSGKWYWEWDCGSTDGNFQLGVIDAPTTRNILTGTDNVFYDGWTIEASAGKKATHGGTGVSYGSAYADDDIGMVAVDMDNGEIWWGEGGTWFNSGDPAARTNPAYTDLLSGYTGAVAPGVEVNGDNVGLTMNFGQLGFEHTIPVGFKSLCTANLPAPTITDPSKYFQTKLFTGTGAELAITLTNAAGAAVKPDLVWIKDRDSTVEHVWTDSVRGATKELNPSSNAIESTVAQGLKSFDTSGFTLGTDSNYNASSSPNVAWCWTAGGGAGSSNEDGSTNTGTTSVNTTAGFSLSTYAGSGSTATIGHGLGVAPGLVIVKRVDVGLQAWPTWFEGFGVNDYLVLEGQDVLLVDSAFFGAVPTSTLVTVGSTAATNASGSNYVMACFAAIDGYSKFGLYEGNGNADGSFIWCGFRPAWIMCKSKDSTSEWYVYDDKRDGYNVDNDALVIDTGAELTADNIDILSNGFKLRIATDPNVAETYAFAAFAEFPFGGEDVSQARAR